jgi:hypothetical protein
MPACAEPQAIIASVAASANVFTVFSFSEPADRRKQDGAFHGKIPACAAPMRSRRLAKNQPAYILDIPPLQAFRLFRDVGHENRKRRPVPFLSSR